MSHFLKTCGATAFAFALMCCFTAKHAQALIFFDDPVSINLSTLGGGLVDAGGITRLDFDGNLAINGTNLGLKKDGVTLQDGVAPAAGVSIRAVGFAVNDGGIQSGSDITGGLSATAGQTVSFEVTAVIRDWNAASVSGPTGLGTTDAEVEVTWASGARTDGGGINLYPTAGAGLIDLFLDTGEDYSTTDADASANGTWIGTFALTTDQATTPGTEPRTVFGWDDTATILNGGGDTRAVLKLIASPFNNLWQSAGGDDLLGGGLALLTLTSSSETVQPNPPLTSISGGVSSSGFELPTVGAGFDPATTLTGAGFTGSNFPNDVTSTFDSNNAFHVVPEPSSLALLSMGLFGMGIVGRKRDAGRQSPPEAARNLTIVDILPKR